MDARWGVRQRARRERLGEVLAILSRSVCGEIPATAGPAARYRAESSLRGATCAFLCDPSRRRTTALHLPRRRPSLTYPRLTSFFLPALARWRTPSSNPRRRLV